MVHLLCCIWKGSALWQTVSTVSPLTSLPRSHLRCFLSQVQETGADPAAGDCSGGDGGEADTCRPAQPWSWQIVKRDCGSLLISTVRKRNEELPYFWGCGAEGWMTPPKYCTPPCCLASKGDRGGIGGQRTKGEAMSICRCPCCPSAVTSHPAWGTG